MLKSRYCPSCGKQNPVLSNFCGGCGASLNSLANKPKPVIPTFQPFILKGDEDDEDDNYLDRISHLDIKIDRLEVEIPTFNRNRETIGSLQQNPIDPKELKKSKKGKKQPKGPYSDVSKDDFIKLYQKEIEKPIKDE